MKIQLAHTYADIISIPDLLAAWREFVRGKRGKSDVQEFQSRLIGNIVLLHRNLANLTYRHGLYKHFKINDPKPRDIHKASVQDRLVHHALHRKLYPFFDRIFIPDSFSCRKGKGTHKAINRFRAFAHKTSQNNTKTCWVLKCDIRKFFANIDHETLKNILARYITDQNTPQLLGNVVESFHSTRPGLGLPLGNLTSQLLVNIYMNEFDQFVKHELKVKYYIRYADDFVIFSRVRVMLESLIPQIQNFLSSKLKLNLHPNKVFIKTLSSGVDFLGWVNFPYHRVLRTATKRRMFRQLEVNHAPETVGSYLGLLGHGNTYKLRKKVFDMIQSADVH